MLSLLEAWIMNRGPTIGSVANQNISIVWPIWLSGSRNHQPPCSLGLNPQDISGGRPPGTHLYGARGRFGEGSKRPQTPTIPRDHFVNPTFLYFSQCLPCLRQHVSLASARSLNLYFHGFHEKFGRNLSKLFQRWGDMGAVMKRPLLATMSCLLLGRAMLDKRKQEGTLTKHHPMILRIFWWGYPPPNYPPPKIII